MQFLLLCCGGLIDLKLSLAAVMSPPTVWSSNGMSLFYSNWAEESAEIRVKFLDLSRHQGV